MTAEVDHRDLASAGSEAPDLCRHPRHRRTAGRHGVNGRLVSLDNMVDKAAMKEKLAIVLRELGALNPFGLSGFKAGEPPLPICLELTMEFFFSIF